MKEKEDFPDINHPFVSKVGLFGKPTLNHNIETVYWVRDILRNGHKWFSSQGKKGHKGPHSYSVSGRVKNPGVKLAPAGITMNELLNDYCGGMQDGHKFFWLSSGWCLWWNLTSIESQHSSRFWNFRKHGCFIGSGAIVVFSDKDNIKMRCLKFIKIFQ